MERWHNRVAVVTGASSGIGAAVAKDLVTAGLVVVGLARRVERVEALKEQLGVAERKRLHAVKCDISQSESVDEAFDWIEKHLGGVDVLINNAGCFVRGQLSTMELRPVQDTLQTNVMGVVYCTQRAFKSMKERHFDGHVVLINSVLGHSVLASSGEHLPVLNIYPATKFAITAINEVYRQEFRAMGTKVRVTSISPGLVDTEIVPEDFKPFKADQVLQTADISRAVLFALSAPPHVQVHELTIKAIGEEF